MIRNILGQAVTKSTIQDYPEFRGQTEIGPEDLAKVALALKSTQGKGVDETETIRVVEKMRIRARPDLHSFTLGWIYNATGGAITLAASREWGDGSASSNLYPLRIENGQWGVFLYVHNDSESSAGIVYEGFNTVGKTCYWCVAWTLADGCPQVYVKIGKDPWDSDDEWNIVKKALDESGPVNRATQEGWRSVISASVGPDAVFEALLTMEHL